MRLGVRVEPVAITAVTHDVSRVGLFVRTSRVLAPGVEVVLKLSLPTGSARATGIVRWAKRVPQQLLSDVRGGMGIEFSSLSGELKTYLAKTLN